LFFLAVLIERFCKQKIFEGLVLLGKAFGLEKRFSFLSSTGKRECVCVGGDMYMMALFPWALIVGGRSDLTNIM
jgi:hypothetical protein